MFKTMDCTHIGKASEKQSGPRFNRYAKCPQCSTIILISKEPVRTAPNCPACGAPIERDYGRAKIAGQAILYRKAIARILEKMNSRDTDDGDPRKLFWACAKYLSLSWEVIQRPLTEEEDVRCAMGLIGELIQTMRPKDILEMFPLSKDMDRKGYQEALSGILGHTEDDCFSPASGAAFLSAYENRDIQQMLRIGGGSQGISQGMLVI